MLIRPDENINIKLNLEGTRRLVAAYPWIRRRDLAHFKPGPEAGTVVRFQDAAGNFLGHGLADQGEILYRVLSRERRPALDEAWFAQKVEGALGLRRHRMDERHEGALRVLHGESDGLPGLSADLYAGWLVLDIASAGAAAIADMVEKALLDQLRPAGMVRRVRFSSGKGKALATALEPVFGGKAPARVEVCSGGVCWKVSLEKGCDLRHGPAVALAASASAGRQVLLHGVVEEERYEAACRNAGAAGLQRAAGDLLENLARLAAKNQAFGLVVQGIAESFKSRYGIFRARNDAPRLVAAALQRVLPGGEALFVAADCGYGSESLPAVILQAAELAGADVELAGLASAGDDFTALAGFPEGLDFRVAKVRVHKPGTADLTVKTKKAAKKKKSGKSRGKREDHA